ncbi:hypothetical protein VITFI_CDS3243 [Vitreoscilla filiformis]|uniref:Uncharacterized protein n=1 Tax=Vitreoscilla filiformis TaxID=63 RepID=A0A221KBP1_VITFI|nr:hypothetical protein [Vitreoscilla filiformis]ASM75875.1 hypothetical protein VITFI_CDS0096 [Vitreoscilla filiformis]ASM76451.1 hypothetical protein VITFI_CDS0672 [Vitreoscilla filiformis]ASM76824.1 hypothetical protein VITFI_CDS1046 [Vitreoscilla filiformis]ASM77326.1 hypothetical protein VITFI_CDS1548 [Vitreoscilla filiformis]ASM79020.1 hypothetical protein VITFI_CDS3243 [Vitreoscilla filiformis]
MATTDLRFAAGLPASSALLFGDDGTAPVFAAQMAVGLPGVTLTAGVTYEALGRLAQVAVTLPAVTPAGAVVLGVAAQAAVILPRVVPAGAGVVGVAVQAAVTLPTVAPAGAAVLGVAVQAAVTLPSVVPVATLQANAVTAVAAVQVGGPVVPAGVGVYDADVSRGPARDIGVSHQRAVTLDAAVVAVMAPSAPVAVQAAVTYAPLRTMHQGARLMQVDTARLGSTATMRQIDARRLSAGARYRHRDHQRCQVAAQVTHADARQMGSGAAFKQRDLLRTARPWLDVRARPAAPRHTARPDQWQVATPMPLVWQASSRDAVRPPPGVSVMPGSVIPVNTCCGPRTPDLRFFVPAPASPHLIFRCDRQLLPGIIVPARRVYLVINDVQLVRADDGTAINCTSLTLSADVDSWAWRWSASIAASDQAKLAPAAGAAACELLAHVNGQVWRVIVESAQRDREWSKSSLSIGGRSASAIWDAPYAAKRTFNNAVVAAMTQQLALDTLATNGVPSDWAIDWQVPDWLVPAGVWSHQGTPISAICRIAEAAGGYVQSSPAGNELMVLPRYLAAPWAWDSLVPDIELPAAVVRQEGIEWTSKAIYSRVFVSGTTAGGVLGRVTRGGTAGDLVAPMITDALCTDVQAARARALPVLSDVGRQALVQLRLPVLAQTGAIVPGKLVQYVDGDLTRLGMTRSLSIQAGRASVWQTIGVQTYEQP